MDEIQIKFKMQGAIDSLRQDMSGIRTGRATPALVENIVVDAYGGTSKLRILELSSISAPDPQSLLITPWDKTVIGDIKKAIELSNIGLNPMIQGDALRIALPPLTQEDREKYVKLLHQKLEGGKIQVRQLRQDGMHEIKKAFENKTVNEDERELQEKNLQKTTDDFMSLIDEVGKIKEQELRGN